MEQFTCQLILNCIIYLIVVFVIQVLIIIEKVPVDSCLIFHE